MMGMLRTGGRARCASRARSCPRGRDRVLQAELLHRHEPAAAGRHRAALGPVGHRPRSCGAATTRTRKARSPFTREHLRQVMSHLEPEQIQQIARRQQRRALRLRHRRARGRPPTSTARPSREIAEPLTTLPEGANEALLRSAGDLAKARLTCACGSSPRTISSTRPTTTRTTTRAGTTTSSTRTPRPPGTRWLGAHGQPAQRAVRGDDRVPVPARRAGGVHVQAAAHRGPRRARRRRPEVRRRRAVRGAPRHLRRRRVRAREPARDGRPRQLRSRATRARSARSTSLTAVSQPSGW